jgi:hypothetical protein
MDMNESQKRTVFLALLASWTMAAILFAFISSRLLAIVIVPIAIALWYAAHAARVKQSTQLVLPVMMLPGTLMCFVGAMQAFGYGQMAGEPDAPYLMIRAAFFVSGLLLHLAAYWLLAGESRASDHPSGERATKI